MSESSSDKRNDKKTKPKKRGTKDKSPDKSPQRSTTPPIQNPTTSITDVFADHLIQKARKVIEPPLSVKKAEKSAGTTNDGFDIPTISEIAKKAVGAVVCRKEITELAELQKKIDQAKRQLRHMADESEDEDFINLGADKMDFDAELSNNGKDPGAGDKSKLDSHDETAAGKSSEAGKAHQKITFEERNNEFNRKQSVLERLGTKGENDKDKGEQSEKSKNIISLSANRRMEQAIYVPAHRRTADQTTSSSSRRSEHDKGRDRSPARGSDSRRSLRVESRVTRDSQTRSRIEPRDLRERVNKQRERDIELRGTRLRREASRESRETHETTKNEDKPIMANRIGSRVIVAPTKPEYVEDDIQVPVNSVVKVKPRPLIPRSKQASKNLLLRAVAEAQKSTALVKPPTREFAGSERNSKELYTKSFRNKLQKDNIVVEIATDDAEGIDVEDAAVVDELEVNEEEYVPKAAAVEVEDHPFVYVPQVIHNNG